VCGRRFSDYGNRNRHERLHDNFAGAAGNSVDSESVEITIEVNLDGKKIVLFPVLSKDWSRRILLASLQMSAR
jgi:hypothetical protein